MRTALSRRYPRRRAFITGAASGLGRALAACLADDGWTLGLADCDAARLDETVAALDHAHPFVFDVANAAAFSAAADAFVARAGGVDVVVNNAGIAAAGAFEETTDADWEALVRVNLMGVVHGCRAFLPALRMSGGHLINIASAAAVAAGPYMSVYNATKAAVLALSETLHAELFDEGVSVSVALPTFFQTNIAEAQRGPAVHRQITRHLLRKANRSADEVAAHLLDGAARGRLHLLYPPQARRIWYWKRLFPAWYRRSMVRVQRATARYLARAEARGGLGR